MLFLRKRRKKMFAVFSGILAVIIAAVICVQIFFYYHPTHYKFNDRFILGNTRENIEEKYGKLELYANSGEYAMVGRYLAEKGYPDITLESFLGAPMYDRYYSIYFDENGIAQKVELIEQGN